MARGGARNRSGPTVDPKSARSDVRGLKFTALPREGFQGKTPDFPLPAGTDENLTSRERSIWVEVWQTPQAAAWNVERWRWSIIGEYCRLKATVEFDTAASAALIGQLHRYRDQIGLTPAGLKENGWALAADEVQEKRNDKQSADKPAAGPQRRLRAVNGDG